jgi:excisionase family DNA binding protein
MAVDQVPLYVRLNANNARLLEQAAATSGRSKRRLIEDAVEHHLGDGGLVVGRAELLEDAPEILSRTAAPEILSLEEAAGLLRVDPDALRAAATRGEVPGRRIGEEWRFAGAALLAWLGSAA